MAEDHQEEGDYRDSKLKNTVLKNYYRTIVVFKAAVNKVSISRMIANIQKE